MENTKKKLPIPALIAVMIGGIKLFEVIALILITVVALPFVLILADIFFDPYSGGIDTVACFGDGRYHIDKLCTYYNGQDDVRIYCLCDVTADDDNYDIVDDVISYFESEDGKLYVCGEDDRGAAAYAVIDLNDNCYAYSSSTYEFPEEDRAVFELDNVFTMLENRHEKFISQHIEE